MATVNQSTRYEPWWPTIICHAARYRTHRPRQEGSTEAAVSRIPENYRKLIWLVVWNMNYIFFPYVGNVIIPTDKYIF